MASDLRTMNEAEKRANKIDKTGLTSVLERKNCTATDREIICHLLLRCRVLISNHFECIYPIIYPSI